MIPTRIEWTPVHLPPRQKGTVRILAPTSFKFCGFWIPPAVRDSLAFWSAATERDPLGGGLCIDLTFSNLGGVPCALSGFVFDVNDVLARAP